MQPKAYLSPSAARSYLAEQGVKVELSTLAKWRHLGCGPAYSIVAGRCLYLPPDIDTWLLEQRRVRT